MVKKSNREKPTIAKVVAVGFLDSDWSEDVMVASAIRAFKSKDAIWLQPLAKSCVDQFEGSPSLGFLTRFIASDQPFRSAIKVYNVKAAGLSTILNGRPLVSIQWNLPKIDSLTDLSSWLGIRRRDLNWLANLHSSDLHEKSQTGKHYVCTWIRKRSSGWRLIESPKPLLKDAQRQINCELLSRIRPHMVAHGFRKGHSVLTYVAPHVEKPVCLKMDLSDFFPCITFGRVWGLFRNSGYSRDVSRWLAAICTCQTESSVLESPMLMSIESVAAMKKIYDRRHLPQGAPTSPVIANLIAYGLDARLNGLASSQGFSFTRYADDLLFSGDERLAKNAKRFEATVGAIAIEEGFQIQFRKTRLMRASQRQLATGIVINERTNIPRRQYDSLRATLYNCVRHGADEENRNQEPDFRRHLEGRIQWVARLNPVKAKKLQALFAQIKWPD